MDVHEDARKNLVTASFEFPGLSKNDVQISIHNGRLVVEADTKKSTETENVDSEKGYYVVRERWVGRLWRSLQLPLGIKVHIYIYVPVNGTSCQTHCAAI